MIAYLSTFAALTGGLFAALMYELREAPAEFPGPEAGPAAPPDGGHGVMAVRQARAGEPVKPWERYDATVQGWGRIARRQQAGWRAQTIITAARVGRIQAAASRVAAQAIAEADHLMPAWQDSTGSFRAICAEVAA